MSLRVGEVLFLIPLYSCRNPLFKIRTGGFKVVSTQCYPGGGDGRICRTPSVAVHASLNVVEVSSDSLNPNRWARRGGGDTLVSTASIAFVVRQPH